MLCQSEIYLLPSMRVPMGKSLPTTKQLGQELEAKQNCYLLTKMNSLTCKTPTLMWTASTMETVDSQALDKGKWAHEALQRAQFAGGGTYMRMSAQLWGILLVPSV